VRSDVDHPTVDECTRCGYLGWAATAELSDSMRRQLRALPVERRRLRLV
jgi:hypothetical protein